MAFEQFPYTDYHSLNLDWILEKVKEFNERLDNIRSNILEESKAYTDGAISQFNSRFNRELEQFRADYAAFRESVNSNLQLFQTQLDLFDAKIDAQIIAVNARTDLAIEQNNDYIIQKVEDNISEVLVVVDPFTGEVTTIQDMISELSRYHMQNAATWGDVQTGNKTWEAVTNFAATWQQIAINGKNYF